MSVSPVTDPPSRSTTTTWVRDYALVARAIEALDASAGVGGDRPSIAELAGALHVSSGHLHRTFARFAGTSPQRFARWLAADAARVLLAERRSVLDTATRIGVSSPGRLHDLLVTVDGVTPGEVGTGGAGLTIRVARHATPFGYAAVAATDRGLLSLRFLDGPDAEVVAAIRAEWPRAEVRHDPEVGLDAVALLAAVGVGASPPAPSGRLPVGLVGTNLQLKVWEALVSIPDDGVVTYAEVAAAVERPDAVRAVAGAIGRNPVAALIPCHRVLRSTGGLGGYAWGTVRKRALLAREAAQASG